MRKEDEPITRREAIVGSIYGLLGLASLGLLFRNESVDRQQQKALEKHNRVLNLVGEYMVADLQEGQDLFENDNALLRALNAICEDLDLPKFYVEEGMLVREHE